MPRILEYFPPSALALDEEIRKNHFELAHLLAKYPTKPLEVKMAAIAAYCNIATDGWFNENDLEQLFELLLKKLKEKSMITVHTGTTTKQ